MLQESFCISFKPKEIESWKNMVVNTWLSWKRQVTWTDICHIKLFPDKSQSLVAFASILKKSY